MSEEYEIGSFSDTETRRVFRPGSVWYTPAVERVIQALLTAGLIALCAISISEK